MARVGCCLLLDYNLNGNISIAITEKQCLDGGITGNCCESQIQPPAAQYNAHVTTSYPLTSSSYLLSHPPPDRMWTINEDGTPNTSFATYNFIPTSRPWYLAGENESSWPSPYLYAFTISSLTTAPSYPASLAFLDAKLSRVVRVKAGRDRRTVIGTDAVATLLNPAGRRIGVGGASIFLEGISSELEGFIDSDSLYVRGTRGKRDVPALLILACPPRGDHASRCTSLNIPR